MEERHAFAHSTAITHGAYDPDTRVLTLWFKSHPYKPRKYAQVPVQAWAALRAHHSPGAYVREHIQSRYRVLF